jgi:CBS-domain-containing membrane protein
MKVKEIMQRDVKSLKPDDNAREALVTLLKLQISGLPVIDRRKKLAGMFTEKEILTKILPSYIKNVGSFVYDADPKVLKEKIAHFSGLKVKDVMRTDVVTVEEDTAVYEAAHLMLTHKARRLPVLNKAKEVVGILARVDVVKALYGA